MDRETVKHPPLLFKSDRIGVSSVVAAMLGLSVLLLTGVLQWDDCLSEKSAWDTLAWFAVLVGMAGQLTNLGIVSWMSGCVANALKAMHLRWPAAFGVLQAAYFFVHYLFASQTGHVGALYSAFLAMHLASRVPGVLAVLALAYNTNLFGALTHYSSGQAVVYYGAHQGLLILAPFSKQPKDNFQTTTSSTGRYQRIANRNVFRICTSQSLHTQTTR